MQSRRQFLTDGLRAGSAAAIMPVGTFFRNAPAHMPLAKLHHHSFTPHIHSIFRVSNGRNTVAMMLVEATATKSATGEKFSLRFRGPARADFEQGTYRFEHAGVGAFDLFIVPGSGNQSVRHYRAVINRA